nr:MAG: hypothetical protein AM324_16455 [Candidatus Thorarchaeota archaeon SMTZ1-83]
MRNEVHDISAVPAVLLFQKARTILCLCACCGEIVRLSDLKLRCEGVTPETWLGKYERSVSLIRMIHSVS